MYGAALCPVIELGSSLDLDPGRGNYNLVLRTTDSEKTGSRVDGLELSPRPTACVLSALGQLFNLSGLRSYICEMEQIQWSLTRF